MLHGKLSFFSIFHIIFIKRFPLQQSLDFTFLQKILIVCILEIFLVQYFYRQQDVSFLAQTTTNLLLTDVIGLGTGDDYERGGETISGRVLCYIFTLKGGF